MATATPPQPVKVVLRSHEPPAVSLQDLATHDLQIDLGWDTFQHTVDTFVKEIDSFVGREKEAIAQSTERHRDDTLRFDADKEEYERQIQIENQRERDMLTTIESERHTVSELHDSVNRLKAALNKVVSQNGSLDNELDSVRKELRSERANKEHQVKTLGEMKDRDDVELTVYQNALGLSITGVGPNRLLFIFTLIDPAAPKREFSFVVDVAQQYKVPQCDPPLAAMPALVQQLNEDRDLHGFLKQVRKSFVEHVGQAAQSGLPPSTE